MWHPPCAHVPIMSKPSRLHGPRATLLLSATAFFVGATGCASETDDETGKASDALIGNEIANNEHHEVVKLTSRSSA